MGIKLKNNAVSLITTPISASDVGLAVTSGDGSKFPTLASGDYFYATLTSLAGTSEIVKVTARVGDTMTIVRAQEGTSANSFPADSRIELRVTVGNVEGGTYTPSGTSAVARTLQEKIREAVSVKDFGAVGDGVTDDTAAIQAAIDSLTAGGTVYFAEGDYLVSETIEINNDNVTIDFNNQPVSFDINFTPNGAPDYGIYNVMFALLANNIKICNGNFNQGSFAETGIFLWVGLSTSNNSIYNSSFYDLLYQAGTLGVAIQTRTSTTGIVVRDCYFENCKAAVVAQGSSSDILNCISVNNNANGGADSMFSLDGGEGNSIVGCKITKTQTSPVSGNIIQIGPCQNWIVSDNYISGLKGGIGIHITDANSGTVGTYGEISNNIIDGAGLTATTSWAMIRLEDGAAAITINNNTLSNPAITGSPHLGFGIDAYGQLLRVLNNQIYLGQESRVYAGIQIAESTLQNTIEVSGNHVVTANRGVYAYGTTNNGYSVTIKNNIWDSMAVAIITDFTTAPLFLENDIFIGGNFSGAFVQDNYAKWNRQFQFGNAANFPYSIRGTNTTIFSSEVPSTPNYDGSTWYVGDTIWNSNPVVGQPIGWRCTVQGEFGTGSPPTFVAMANL